VIDGNTIVMESESGSERIRLAEIDAPESKQAHDQGAADYLARLILNRQVTIQYSNPPQGCATQEGRAPGSSAPSCSPARTSTPR